MQGELLQLFPTPVGKLKGRAPTEQENYVINNFLKELQPNAGNKITASKNVLEHPGLATLKDDITTLVNEYYNMVYRPQEPITLYITTSWCNVTTKGDFHHEHFHYNSLLSGTYYIEADMTDSIVFKRDPRDTLPLLTLPKEDELNPFNAASYTMNIDRHDIAIFPSLLTHLVDPLFRDGTRISISFNTFATGNFGSPNNLTQLNLR